MSNISYNFLIYTGSLGKVHKQGKNVLEKVISFPYRQIFSCY